MTTLSCPLTSSYVLCVHLPQPHVKINNNNPEARCNDTHLNSSIRGLRQEDGQFKAHLGYTVGPCLEAIRVPIRAEANKRHNANFPIVA